MSYQKEGCLCCGTFPYIDSTGMCAACTFGEADAQQELISGKIEGAVWEREQPKKNKRKKRRKPKNKGGDLERHECDIAKELLEVDLSSELTGSDLARAMLARGDKWVLCLVANNPKNIDLDQEPDVVISHDENGFYIRDSYYNCALPISIKGELLTASEVGL